MLNVDPIEAVWITVSTVALIATLYLRYDYALTLRARQDEAENGLRRKRQIRLARMNLRSETFRLFICACCLFAGLIYAALPPTVQPDDNPEGLRLVGVVLLMLIPATMALHSLLDSRFRQEILRDDWWSDQASVPEVEAAVATVVSTTPTEAKDSPTMTDQLVKAAHDASEVALADIKKHTQETATQTGRSADALEDIQKRQ